MRVDENEIILIHQILREITKDKRIEKNIRKVRAGKTAINEEDL